jgi:MinD-like ATPase involved in chromosome partitioning or flagellar assembly
VPSEALEFSEFMSRSITIASGKGGVGKTNIALNLALHLATYGHRVCLFDADLGLGNVNILLGLHPEYDLSNVILDGRELKDIIIKVHNRFDILPGSSGLEEMANLAPDRRDALVESLSEMDRYDLLLFDTSAGISRNVISFCLASSVVVLVITPEPTSLTDSFALLKILALNGFKGEPKVIINQCRDSDVAAMVYRKFKIAAVKHLNMDVSALGAIYQDAKVMEAVRQQRPFLSLYPDASASRCIRQIGDCLMTTGTKRREADNMEGFWSRCFQVIGEPLRLLDGRKERDEHVFRPLFKGGQEKGRQLAQQDRQEDLPTKLTGSNAKAGPFTGEPEPQIPTSYPDEGEKLAAPQMLSSGAPAGAVNMEALMPIAERLIGSISSLTTELLLLRHAVERQVKPLQSK